MRLDKFLKVSGLAKRRPLAKKLCDAGRVKVGDRQAKAGTEIEVGDFVEVRYGDRGVLVEVLAVPEDPVPKGDRRGVFEVKREIRYA